MCVCVTLYVIMLIDQSFPMNCSNNFLFKYFFCFKFLFSPSPVLYLHIGGERKDYLQFWGTVGRFEKVLM